MSFVTRGWTRRKKSKWWKGNDFGFEHPARSAFKQHKLARGNWTYRPKSVQG